MKNYVQTMTSANGYVTTGKSIPIDKITPIISLRPPIPSRTMRSLILAALTCLSYHPLVAAEATSTSFDKTDTIALKRFLQQNPTARARHKIRATIAAAQFEAQKYALSNATFAPVNWQYVEQDEEGTRLYATATAARGIVLYQQGDPAAALPLLQEALPQFPRAAVYIADIHLQAGRYEEALKASKDLTNQEGYAIKGEALFALARYAEAIEELRKITSPTPQSAYALGCSYLHLGAPLTATSVLTQQEHRLSPQEPLYPNYQLALGQAQLQVRNEAEAMTHFSLSNTEEAQYNLALLQHKADNATYTLWTDFLARYPNTQYRPQVKQAISNILLNKMSTEAALSVIATLDVPASTKQILLLRRGMEMLDSTPAEALHLFEQAVNLNANKDVTTEATYMSGEALYRLGRIDEANKLLSLYTTQGHNNLATAYYTLAYIAFNAGRYQEAKQFFTSANTNSMPQHIKTDIQLRLADCEYHARNFDTAIALYSKVGITPYTTFQRAFIAGLRGQTQEKLTLLNQVINSNDTTFAPHALYEKARTHTLLNQTEDARATYQALIAQYPNAPVRADAQAEVELISEQNTIQQEQLRLQQRADSIQTALRTEINRMQQLINTRQYKQAEEALQQFLDTPSDYPYYAARAFTLLAEVYRAEGRKAEAEEILKSLRDNYRADDDIQQIVTKALKQ